MKTNKTIWILLGVGFLMGFSSGAFAEGAAKSSEGKISFGHLSIIPRLALQEEYDDNIFLGNGDNNTTELKESDWITHLKPSLVAKYDLLERGSLSLGYSGDFAYYSTNTFNNWADHNIAFKGDYKAPAGLIVGITNAYVNSDNPYSAGNQYRLGQTVKRWNDDLQTRVGYEFFDKFRVLAFYNFYQLQYDQDINAAQNYNSNEVGIGAEMRIMPMTWAFLRYHSGETKYTSHPADIPNYSDATDASYKSNRINTGLTWDATAKISGELNLGYQWLTPNNEFDSNGTAYEDSTTWIASTRVNYQATPKTRVGTELFRITRFSGGNLSQFYNETGLGVNLNQDVMTKGMLRAGAAYVINDYNQPTPNNRVDNDFKALIGFDYNIKEWLKLGVDYILWNRNSNYSINNFADNRFMMSVGITY